VQFAKVAEFQRREVIHFHALIRLDDQPTREEACPSPAPQCPGSVLAQLVVQAVGQVTCEASPMDGHDVARVARQRGNVAALEGG